MPPAREVTVHWQHYTADQVLHSLYRYMYSGILLFIIVGQSSDTDEASGRIGQFKSDTAKKQQKLSQLTHSLQQQNNARIRSQIKCAKRKLKLCRTKLAGLQKRQRNSTQELEKKEQQLRFLQQLRKQRKKNIELEGIIREKENEIKQLREYISTLKGEVTKANNEIQSLRDDLLKSTSELQTKSVQVQQLERSKSELERSLEREQWRVDQMMLSALPETMRAYSAETQVFCVSVLLMLNILVVLLLLAAFKCIQSQTRSRK